MVFALVLLRSAVKDFLWTPPWWHSFLVAVPAIALPILASFELRHSGEANTLRAEANRLRAEANALEDQLGTLSAELDGCRAEQATFSRLQTTRKSQSRRKKCRYSSAAP